LEAGVSRAVYIFYSDITNLARVIPVLFLVYVFYDFTKWVGSAAKTLTAHISEFLG
jgi:hypothetical protein